MSAQSETHKSPVTEMMGFSYRPDWSEGSLKPPIFQTSTFVFRNAAEGKRYFEVAYGLRPAESDEELGLIYSRINNPNIEILEDRLCRWEQAERGLSFASGMAAIATTMLGHLRPNDLMLYTEPLYGGTDHVVRSILPEFNVRTLGISSDSTEDEIDRLVRSAGGTVAMVYVETPANPTNALVDLKWIRELADRYSSSERRAIVVVDNTFLGPIWQRPLDFGADVSIYSATKHLGGHSDLIAGAIVGTASALEPIGAMRTFLGTMLDPWTAWLLTRSLETLDLRMRQASRNAEEIAHFLVGHPKVRSVSFLGLIEPGTVDHDIYSRQCLGPGSMISIDLGRESDAFAFIDGLDTISLAVSLGGTESLVEHPASMTHAGVPVAERLAHGVTEGLVRLSIGVEHIDDLLADLGAALEAVNPA